MTEDGRGGIGIGRPEMHRDGAALHRQRDDQQDQRDLVERGELQAGGQRGEVEGVVLGEEDADGHQHGQRADGAEQRVLEAGFDGHAVVDAVGHERRARERADFEEHEEVEQVARGDHAQHARHQQEQHRVEGLEAGLLGFGGQRVDRDGQRGERGDDDHQRAQGIHLEDDADGDAAGIQGQGQLARWPRRRRRGRCRW